MLRRRRGKPDVLAAWGLLVLAVSSGSSAWSCAAAVAGSPERSAGARTVEVDGRERVYHLHEPAGAPATGLPLMIVLHGGFGNAESIEATTGMDPVADRGRFLVAYPEGTGGSLGRENRRTWNAGRCCGRSARQNVDDVAFIDRVISDLQKSHSIDLQRVYVAGFSNGGMMAYRFACERPERVAAIIVVSGTLAVDACDRGRDVPVLHIHGEADEHVPYAGGRGGEGMSGVSHRSVPETLQIITRPRKCQAPETKVVSAGDRETLYRCVEGAPVELRLLAGAGHAWPGGRRSGPGSFSASLEAWEFARQHSRTPTRPAAAPGSGP